MRSTKPGIPCSVATISASSSCAGTATATRLPSSMVLRRLRAAEAAFARDRDDRAEDQADQRTDQDRAGTRVRRRLQGAGLLDDLRGLDLLREDELLLERLLLRDQVALARRGVVLLADDHELLERVEVLALRFCERLVVDPELLGDLGDLRLHVLER